MLKKLEQVQELDLQINAILKKQAEFPKRLEGFETLIRFNSEKISEKKKIIDELEKNKRQQVGALELNDERSKRSKERLEQIKTNQEFQALQKEIESLDKNSAVIKENATKVAEELEKHLKEVQGYESTLNDAQTKRDAEAAKISSESSIFETELRRLNALRGDAVVGVDKRYLAVYDKVRQGKNGMGLALALSGNCRGCNMRIPPQIYNELQRGTELYTCPSCRRILVFKDQSKSA